MGDRSNAVLDVLEAIRKDVVEDSLELARRNRQIAQMCAAVAALDAEVVELSDLLSAARFERPA